MAASDPSGRSLEPVAVLLRYFAASLFALIFDYAGFLTLLRMTVPPVPASLLGYAAGICIHWLLSSRVVFGNSVASAGPARNRQKLLFAASALFGAALTGMVMAAATLAAADPLAARIVATAVSFIATWLLRRHVVFSQSARRTPHRPTAQPATL